MRCSLVAVSFAVALPLVTGAGPVAGQPASDELRKQIEELRKARALLEEQQKNLVAEKALVDARKDLVESTAQATAAKYLGDVKAGPYSSAVEMKGNAGTQEAALLAAHAIRTAAHRVAQEVGTAAGGARVVANETGGDVSTPRPKAVHVFAARDLPASRTLLAFRLRKELVRQAFEAAGIPKSGDEKARESGDETTPRGGGERKGLSAGIVSAGLDAISGLLGYFKTDYTVGGVAVKVDESLLLYAAAGELRKSGLPVRLPSLVAPAALRSSAAKLADELGGLAPLRSEAVAKAAALKAEIEHAEKASRRDEAAEKRAQVGRLDAAVALHDSFAASLTAPEASGGLSLSAMTQELDLDSALADGSLVLFLRLENTGGGYMLKKNLWTGLGAVPLYHMGGATVAYLLLGENDGIVSVLAGGVVPVFGGYVKSRDLKAELETALP